MSQDAYDGTLLYMVTHDEEAILVVDPTDMTVVDEIVPLLGVEDFPVSLS